MNKFSFHEIQDPTLFTKDPNVSKFLVFQEISNLVLQFYLEQITYIDQVPEFFQEYRTKILNYFGEQWINFYESINTLILIKNKNKIVGMALFLTEKDTLTVPIFAIDKLDQTNLLIFLIKNLVKKPYKNIRFCKPLQDKIENIFNDNKFYIIEEKGFTYYNRSI